MPITIRLSVIAGFVAALFCAPAGASGTVPLGPAHALGGGEYSTGGGITVAVELRPDASGKTAICGVWAQSDQLPVYVRHYGDDILARASIAMDGQILTNHLSFLERVAPSSSYAGAPAGCALLNRAWQAGDERRKLEVWIPRQRLVRSGDGMKSVGPKIRFMPTPGGMQAMGKGSLLPKSWIPSSSGS